MANLLLFGTHLHFVQSIIKICRRQVFLVMYCLGAVCRDAADASENKFEEDCKRHRSQAVGKVEADIISLLKCTTPYLLASKYGAVLAQLVYLRRALTSEAGKASIGITH